MTIIALAFALLAQETVDNPEYKGWAPFKPGSSVTYRTTKDGAVQPGTQKVTLKSLSDSEAVIETEYSMDGKAMGKPMERKVAAKAPAAQAAKNVKEGEEEVEAGGKKLKCRTREFEKKLPSGKTVTVKFWINEEVPGMAVQMETTGEGSPKTTMVASGWEKK